MMFVQIKNKLEYNLRNSFSWRSRRKIVVFESDDWGGVRMASYGAYRSLLEKGVQVDKDHYCKYDALESEDDLSSLFETLYKFRDKHQRPVVFTANCLMANPDFERIRRDHYLQYHYQPVKETFLDYPKHAKSYDLWLEGNRTKVFHPQFHGREHVNVVRWMKALKANRPETRMAFNEKVFGISTHISMEDRESFMEAFAARTKEEAEQVHNIVIDGLRLFENTLGYPSESVIAPNYCWSSDLEKTFSKQGVNYIQGNRLQHEALLRADKKTIRKVHVLGERNKQGQVYLVRNCHFEPSSSPQKNWVDHCLKQIADSFRTGSPAIICTHRVNYIGFIREKNRIENLKKLRELLRLLLLRWPDVEFLSSDELGRLISQKEKHENIDYRRYILGK